MSEFIRKRVAKDLIDELADIDPISLEIVGHKVIETLESKEMVHHGINKDYKPVSYTVDSFSQDFTVVGQYSTEEKYFDDSSGAKHENRFDKIKKDIQHALEKSGEKALEKIYLVSSSEEPASFRGKFNKSDLGKEHGARAIFLDARELAKIIFQSSQDNPHAVDFYRYYLPDFAQNLDNYEYYGRVPPVCPVASNAVMVALATGAPVATVPDNEVAVAGVELSLPPAQLASTMCNVIEVNYALRVAIIPRTYLTVATARWCLIQPVTCRTGATLTCIVRIAAALTRDWLPATILVIEVSSRDCRRLPNDEILCR